MACSTIGHLSSVANPLLFEDSHMLSSFSQITLAPYGATPDLKDQMPLKVGALYPDTMNPDKVHEP